MFYKRLRDYRLFTRWPLEITRMFSRDQIASLTAGFGYCLHSSVHVLERPKAQFRVNHTLLKSQQKVFQFVVECRMTYDVIIELKKERKIYVTRFLSCSGGCQWRNLAKSSWLINMNSISASGKNITSSSNFVRSSDHVSGWWSLGNNPQVTTLQSTVELYQYIVELCQSTVEWCSGCFQLDNRVPNYNSR